MTLILFADVCSNFDTDNEYVDDKIKVLFDLSLNELIIMLNEFLNEDHNVSSKLKNLKKSFLHLN